MLLYLQYMRNTTGINDSMQDKVCIATAVGSATCAFIYGFMTKSLRKVNPTKPWFVTLRYVGFVLLIHQIYKTAN